MSDVKRYFVGSVSHSNLGEICYWTGPCDFEQLKLDTDMKFVLASDYDALASRLAEAERRAERLSAVILWALGEGDEFPMRPDDWETRKYKPWYWWRGELRKRYDAALSPRHQSAEGAEGEGT